MGGWWSVLSGLMVVCIEGWMVVCIEGWMVVCIEGVDGGLC